MTAISNAGVPKNRTAGDGEKVNRDNIFTGPMEVGRFKEPNGTHSWVLTRGGQDHPPAPAARPAQADSPMGAGDAFCGLPGSTALSAVSGLYLPLQGSTNPEPASPSGTHQRMR